MKNCNDCKIVKPLSEFNKDNKSKDKLTYICKSCSSKKSTDFNKSIRGRYKIAKAQALARGQEFKISSEFHAKLLIQKCHYCKADLNETGSAMDRVDNNKGYIESNVVPCCANCNYVKSDVLNYEEMVVAMKAILKLRVKIKQTFE